jgi:hypothetical protein
MKTLSVALLLTTLLSTLALPLGCATAPPPVKEGSWDFGTYPLLIGEVGAEAKPFTFSFKTGARKSPESSFLRTTYFSFRLPQTPKPARYRITTSRLLATGCDLGNPTMLYLLDDGAAQKELGTGAGAELTVASRTPAKLVLKIDNASNCNKLDYSLAVVRL